MKNKALRLVAAGTTGVLAFTFVEEGLEPSRGPENGHAPHENREPVQRRALIGVLTSASSMTSQPLDYEMRDGRHVKFVSLSDVLKLA